MKIHTVKSRSRLTRLGKYSAMLLALLPGGMNAAPLYWTGEDSGGANTTWNTSNTNWNAINATTTGDTAYANGNDVVFSTPLVNPASGNVGVTVSGTVTPGSMLFQKTGGTAQQFGFTGGTIALPATVVASAGGAAPGAVTFGSSLQVNQNVDFSGGTFYLAGALSGNSDIIYENTATGSSTGLFLDAIATGSGVTNAFDGSGFNGTYRVNSGRLTIATNTRIFSTGGKSLYVGDGSGTAASAILSIGANGGLTSADTIEVASDGQILVGGHSSGGAALRFVGGGEIFRNSGPSRGLTTGSITVTSGTALAYGTNLQLTFNTNTIFDIAADAEFQMIMTTGATAVTKLTPGTFMRKTGEGSLLFNTTLATASTGFKVEQGTLEFGSAAVLPTTTSIELAGGTMLAENIDLSLNNFTVSANSTLDFGSADGVDLWFSGAAALGANTITVLNFDSLAGDTFRFWDGSAATLTSDQAAQFQFGGGAYGAIDSQGYVTAVPEPSTWGLLCAGLLTVMMRRRQRARAIAA